MRKFSCAGSVGLMLLGLLCSTATAQQDGVPNPYMPSSGESSSQVLLPAVTAESIPVSGGDSAERMERIKQLIAARDTLRVNGESELAHQLSLKIALQLRNLAEYEAQLAGRSPAFLVRTPQQTIPVQAIIAEFPGVSWDKLRETMTAATAEIVSVSGSSKNATPPEKQSELAGLNGKVLIENLQLNATQAERLLKQMQNKLGQKSVVVLARQRQELIPSVAANISESLVFHPAREAFISPRPPLAPHNAFELQLTGELNAASQVTLQVELLLNDTPNQVKNGEKFTARRLRKSVMLQDGMSTALLMRSDDLSEGAASVLLLLTQDSIKAPAANHPAANAIPNPFFPNGHFDPAAAPNPYQPELPPSRRPTTSNPYPPGGENHNVDPQPLIPNPYMAPEANYSPPATDPVQSRNPGNRRLQ